LVVEEAEVETVLGFTAKLIFLVFMAVEDITP